jgi:prevent-host-death family protein
VYPLDPQFLPIDTIAIIDMIDMIIAITNRGRAAQVKRKVSAVEARKRLGEILESVYYRGDEVVIERAGKPMAVVIPAARYESMERTREQSMDRMFELIEKNWERNKDVPYEVIEREVEQAIREVREEQYGRGEGDKA